MEEEAEPELDDIGAQAQAEPEEEAASDDADGASDEPEQAAPPEKPARSKAGPTPFEFVIGARGYNRGFEYTDPVGQRDTRTPAEGGPRPRHLVPYELPFGPALKASTRFYPAALVRDDVAGWFGIAADFELGLATTTELEEPGKPVQTLKTSTQAWDAGLRFRVPIGPVELGVFGMYGQHSFILVGDEGGVGGIEPLVPDVQYNFIRAGGDIRVRVSKLLLAAHVAPRFLLTLHQLDLEYVWFPGAKGHGLDFGLEAGWSFLPYLAVVAGGDVIRYGFDFNDIPSDPCDPEDGCRAPVIAGGATDTYISGWLGLRLTLGGGK
jgi:hypothetical protein